MHPSLRRTNHSAVDAYTDLSSSLLYASSLHPGEVSQRIVLLSDGFPTEPDPDNGGAQMSNDTILDNIEEANRYKRWRIDTFGFGAAGAQMGDFMSDLAERNGGSYTEIN